MDGDMGPYDILDVRMQAADTIVFLDLTRARLLRMSRRTGSRFARSSARSASVSVRGFLASRRERRATSAASGPIARSIAAVSSSSSLKNPPPCEPGCTGTSLGSGIPLVQAG